jgi:hypothetical protein
MKNIFIYAVSAALMCAVLFCSRNKKERTITPRENVQTITPQEGAAASPEELAAQLTPKLLELQSAVIAAPEDVQARKALVACAVDTLHHIIYAAGQGKPPENATSEAMSRQFMDRAALVDGYRWIAYIAAWSKNPETPEFGRISGEIPPARPVYVDHPSENQAVALVQADASH